ncbi:MAG: hypothetical protein F4X57_10000 [Chloroflexi bacterium]|nr:hypothetical protein [Chloroflexota bacterium]
MTTETREQVDAAEVYSRIGRLEGEVSQMNARLDRIEAAQNRILYWILGIGAAVLASVWVGNLTG